jgi:hypothetical protein
VKKHDRQEVAYHEAGHVVAYHLQGRLIERASILTDYDAGEAGSVVSDNGVAAEERIIGFYAGLAAARLIKPRLGVKAGGASNDYAQARRLLPLVKTDRKALEARAAALIADNRAMVEAVAELLLAEETADGQTVDFVCACVIDGVDWRAHLNFFRPAGASPRRVVDDHPGRDAGDADHDGERAGGPPRAGGTGGVRSGRPGRPNQTRKRKKATRKAHPAAGSIGPPLQPRGRGAGGPSRPAAGSRKST